jgi:hypothetical protein
VQHRYERDEIPAAMRPVVERSFYDPNPPRLSEPSGGHISRRGVTLKAGYLIDDTLKPR